MSQDSPDVTAARIEAARARARLMDTAQDLQTRLSPKTLAQNAWDGAKAKGTDLAEDAVDTVRQRPIAAGGVAAAVALYLARKPLGKFAGKLFRRGRHDDDYAIGTSEFSDRDYRNTETM